MQYSDNVLHDQDRIYKFKSKWINNLFRTYSIPITINIETPQFAIDSNLYDIIQKYLFTKFPNYIGGTLLSTTVILEVGTGRAFKYYSTIHLNENDYSPGPLRPVDWNLHGTYRFPNSCYLMLDCPYQSQTLAAEGESNQVVVPNWTGIAGPPEYTAIKYSHTYGNRCYPFLTSYYKKIFRFKGVKTITFLCTFVTSK